MDGRRGLRPAEPMASGAGVEGGRRCSRRSVLVEVLDVLQRCDHVEPKKLIRMMSKRVCDKTPKGHLPCGPLVGPQTVVHVVVEVALEGPLEEVQLRERRVRKAELRCVGHSVRLALGRRLRGPRW